MPAAADFHESATFELLDIYELTLIKNQSGAGLAPITDLPARQSAG